jgi:anti-sigma factor RsiW
VRRIDCAELIEDAPELAAGNLTGEERAVVIAHLATCPSCQHEVNALTTVTDRLLLLAPSVEPPAGFEQRVLAAIPTELPGAHQQHRARARVATLLAAAALVLALLAGVGLLIDRTSGDTAFAAAEMRTAGGDVVGQVFVHEGATTSLFMTLPGWVEQIERYAGPGASYTVRVETRDGRVTANPVTLSDTASWSATLDIDAVKSVAVVDASGYVWCQAEFG